MISHVPIFMIPVVVSQTRWDIAVSQMSRMVAMVFNIIPMMLLIINIKTLMLNQFLIDV